MIKQIHIKNFQSHEDSVFDLAPGVNAIVGESHVGKSAVRRLVTWVNTNRPLGDSFIKVGAKRAYGRLEFDDGVVERTKSAKKSTYIVGNNSEPYTAFGSGVPEEVVELINMSEVNFQTQHGSFFLVMDTPGSVATYLRSVTGLDELSVVAADVGTKLRSAKSNLTMQEQELVELSEELEELCQINLDRLEECLNQYHSYEDRNVEIQIEIDRLSQIVDRIEDLQSMPFVDAHEVQRLFGRLDGVIRFKESQEKVEKYLEETISQIEDLQSSPFVDAHEVQRLFGRLDGVIRFKESHEKVEKYLEETISQIEDLRVLDISIRDDLMEDVDAILGEYAQKIKLEEVIGKALESLSCMISVSLEDEDAMAVLQGEVQELLTQLTVCPSCGLELTVDARERLVVGEDVDYI